MLRKYLDLLFQGKDLTREETAAALRIVTSGEVAHSQIGAFLTALRMKGECAAELAGGAAMLRRAATFIDCGGRDAIDIVGTGGDGSNSFNISTTSAIVAAGAGAVVAKHGNRSVSSKCGAADVLRELGYHLEASVSTAERLIANVGIGFLYAPRLHPVLAGVGVLRKELGIRTIFNLLGPLCNPAGVRKMVLGVSSPVQTELFAETLRELGVHHALVVHGMEGLDEISSCGPTRISELKNGEIRTRELLPELAIGEVFPYSDLTGGTPAVNARMLRDVVEGRDHSGRRAAVLLNAGAAIYVAGLAESLEKGAVLAARSIDSGAAKNKLDEMIRESFQ